MLDKPNVNVLRILFGTFGLVFFGIGLTLIVALWFGGVGSPPLFFRIFGSLIAIPFMAFGGASAYGAYLGKVPNGLSRIKRTPRARRAQSTDYTCPSCGAELNGGGDVSPHGDAKCKFCNNWFNIHA